MPKAPNSKIVKTNAMRVLDAQKITYEAKFYSDEIHSAEGAAEALAVPVAHVFKTLVVLPESGKGRPLLVVVPGDSSIELKLLGQQSEIAEKKLRMATQREAESLTGLLVGGISALALLQRGFRVFIDQSALTLEQMYVNGGQRGVNLKLSPTDFIKVTGAIPVITHHEEEAL
jgi:Cys-tRNA(Pro)/Cys-tRNA(Cys) deacylase